MLYSAGLLSAAPALFLNMSFLSMNENCWLCFTGCLSTVVGAWLRFACVALSSYALAITSSLLLGMGMAMVMTGFTDIPDRWFPRPEHGMAGSIAVQIPYAGWGFGTLLVPILVDSVQTMETFMLVQALVVSLSLPGFFLFFPRTITEAKRGDDVLDCRVCRSLAYSAAQMLTNVRFLLIGGACGILQGLAFSVPAIDGMVLDHANLTESQSAILGFIFIISGSVLGIVIGFLHVSDWVDRWLLLGLFWLAAVSFVLFDRLAASTHASFWQAALLMVISGGCSLGFVDLALIQSTLALPEDVPPAHAGSVVSFATLTLSPLFSQWSVDSGFTCCVGVSLATAVMSTCVLPWPAPRDVKLECASLDDRTL